jgi:hypothetical protein
MEEERKRRNRERCAKYRAKPGNMDKARKAALRSMRRHKFGPTAIDHYDICMINQKGFCASCGAKLDKNGSKMEKPNQDHNHKTGELRGLLCGACNIGIGYFKEDIEALKRAIKYLEKYQNK